MLRVPNSPVGGKAATGSRMPVGLRARRPESRGPRFMTLFDQARLREVARAIPRRSGGRRAGLRPRLVPVPGCGLAGGEVGAAGRAPFCVPDGQRTHRCPLRYARVGEVDLDHAKTLIRRPGSSSTRRLPESRVRSRVEHQAVGVGIGEQIRDVDVPYPGVVVDDRDAGDDLIADQSLDCHDGTFRVKD